MKIAYLATVSSHPSGVNKKIHMQIDAWREAGHEVRPFFIAPLDAPFSCFKLWKHLNVLNPQLSCILALKKFAPDCIYLRDQSVLLMYFLLFNLFKNKIVVEINSDHKNEAVLYTYKSIYKKLSYKFNCLTMPMVYRHAAGIICPTWEITSADLYKNAPNKAVIPNSIKLCEHGILKCTASTNGINIIFIGSKDQPWHGIDKMLSIMTKLGAPFHLHIIGSEQSEFDSNYSIPKNVTFHGYLHAHEYKNICKQAHIALSSLARHRNKMKQACPLKSREYLAMGFPIITAYEDPAFGELDKDYILRLPNEENMATRHDVIEQIRNFCIKNKHRIVCHEEVAPYIDVSAWEVKRLEYMQKWCD